MARNRTSHLHATQRKRLLIVLFCMVAAALCYLVFFADQSLVSILLKKRRLDLVEKEKKELIRDNSQLEESIDRINNDPKFLEKIAREKNMLKDNELILDFSGKPSKKNKAKQ